MRLPLPASRTPSSGDDSGAALLISLLTIMIASALSIAVLGSVAAQFKPTSFAQKNTRTAAAAEAGLDTALGLVRTSLSIDPIDGVTVIGDRRLLPCTPGTSGGELTGAVSGSPGSLSYEVTLQYFTADPAGHDQTWLTANALTCSGSGGPLSTPSYAVITSAATGTGAVGTAGDRTIQTVYQFKTTNENVLGGLIHNYYDGNPATLDLCFDAGSAAPAPGTPLLVRTCVPESPQQTFSYRADYTIVLSATEGTSTTSGSCVTSTGSGATRGLVLTTCDGSFVQKWGYTDNGGFAGQPDYNPPTSPSTTNYCIYIVTPNQSGSALSASSSACGGYSPVHTWRPEPRVGAGHAGAVSGPVDNLPLQWVNFEEFGRCFDVTNWNVSWSFMIAYPCKQEPSGYVGWNQTFVWAGTAGLGRFYTVAGWTGSSFATAVANGYPRYCAVAPATDGGYVLMRACDLTTAAQSWTVMRDTGDYATSYTIVDTYGRCMAVGPPDLSGSQSAWSTTVSQRCNGSDSQKWNAPASFAPSGLRDTSELVD